MTVEWYAAAVAAAAAWVWLQGTVLGSVILVLFFSLFGGGAALILGHSTVTPVSFAVIFLIAHTLLSMFNRSSHINVAFKTNSYFAFFGIYGALSAFLLPKIFAKALAVPPMVQNGQKALYVSNSLHFGTQNWTTALYLIATLLASICAGAAATDSRSRRSIIKCAVSISWLHIGFGVLGALLSGSAIIKIFRNATYAELVQSEGGYSRISGVFPEPSAYASFAFVWFVLMVELWMRDVSSRTTFVTALALAVMILACTSTTGYASVAVYGVILAARAIVAPGGRWTSKALPMFMALLIGLVGALVVVNFNSHAAFQIGHALEGLTVGKADTESGRQRLYWAATSFKAIKATWGLGIGAGSFRSSSLLLAILGGVGVIGLIAFVGHFLKILKPLRRDTYALDGSTDNAIAASVAWAACAGLLPQIISSPTPDPSYVFAILGGLALAWRYAGATVLTAHADAVRSPALIQVM